MNDEYVLIKGKALVMVREFEKVYPKATNADKGKRIHDEVWYATNDVIPDARKINTEAIHRVIREIKECTTYAATI